MNRFGFGEHDFAGHDLVEAFSFDIVRWQNDTVATVPETTPIPLPVRDAWMRKLSLQVKLLESWDGPVEVSADPAVAAMHDAYLKDRLEHHRTGILVGRILRRARPRSARGDRPTPQ